MNAIEKAVAHLDPSPNEGPAYNCAQSILAAFAERLGLDRGLALGLACGVGEGVSRQGLTCGSVTGGAMVLGYAARKAARDEETAREAAYEKVTAFVDRFEACCGNTNCHVLLGLDLRTEEGRRAYRMAHMRRSHCAEFVRTAAEIVDDLLDR